MTSKISYIKFILSDIRHRAWLPVLSSISLFLLMPVYSLMYIDSTYPDSGVLAEDDWIFSVFSGLLNGNSFFPLAAAIFILALLAAASGFSYLHSREKLDFYHSLPLRRGQRFLISYMGGLLSFLIPYLICAFLTLAAGSAGGIITEGNALSCATSVLGGTAAFLLVYHTGILAAVVSGTIIAQTAAFLVLCVYPEIVLSLFTTLKETFYKTSCSVNVSLPERLADLASPFGLFDRLLHDSAAADLTASLPACLIFLAVLAAAAYVLCLVYPSEAAGNALAFPVTAPFFKIFICIPTAMCAGFLACTLAGAVEPDRVFLLSVLFAVLLCGLIEYLYQQDFRLLLKNWRSSLIAVGGVLLVLVVMRFDLTGYDTYLPDESRTESVGFAPDSFYSYFTYPDQYSSKTPELQIFAPPEDTGMLLGLAQKGIDNLEAGITPEYINMGSYEETSGYVSAIFQYRLKSGRTVARRYALRQEDILTALENLCENEDYRRDLFPVFHIDSKDILTVSTCDISEEENALSLTAKQRDELINAYREDVLAVSVDTLQNRAPVGELLFTLPYWIMSGDKPDPEMIFPTETLYPTYYPNTEIIRYFYIYPEYENTLALLEEYGCVLSSSIPEDTISEARLFLTQESYNAGIFDSLLQELSLSQTEAEEAVSNGLLLSDREQIRLLTGRISWDTPGIAGQRWENLDSVELTYKSGRTCNYHLQ